MENQSEENKESEEKVISAKTTFPEDNKELKEKVTLNVLYVALFSIVMIFVAFTSAYLVSKADNFWVNITMPQAFWISTALILVSSVTINLAFLAAKKNAKTQVKLFVTLTLLLGIGFGVSQFKGYSELIEKGNYFSGSIMNADGELRLSGEYGKDFTISFKGEELHYEDGIFYRASGSKLNAAQVTNLRKASNTSSSYIYVITFVHFLHILGGLLWLLVLSVKSFANKIGEENSNKVKIAATYWHFVDGLWLYLFLFLFFIH